MTGKSANFGGFVVLRHPMMDPLGSIRLTFSLGMQSIMVSNVPLKGLFQTSMHGVIHLFVGYCFHHILS